MSCHKWEYPGFELRSFIPGRLRLRVPEAIWSDYLIRLRRLVAQDVVGGLEPNRITFSVLIRYDRAHYSQKQFLTCLMAEEQALVMERATEAPQTAVAPEHKARWTVKSDLPGRLRAAHPLLCRYTEVAQQVGMGLLQLNGVTSYSMNLLTSCVLVKYTPNRLSSAQLRIQLDAMVAAAMHSFDVEAAQLAPIPWDRVVLQLTTSTGTLVVASIAKFLPVLAPVAILGTLVASAHILARAVRTLVVDRKIKVDILDATVISLSLAYGYILASAFMVWAVDIADLLLETSMAQSQRMLSQIFGQQAQTTWLLVDGEEVEVPVADLQVNGVVVLRSGDQVPVDGIVVDGEAMVDQQVLTGEFAPAERVLGDAVYAMTTVVAGKLAVRVNQTGTDTQASQIVHIIEESVGYKARLQSTNEKFADFMVLPTMGLGAIGRVVSGSSAMLAIVNCDFGTGIRIAGPLALLSSIAVAAQNGIVIKNGSILESLHSLDAVIFDKTGTLTEEVPMVGRIWSCDRAFTEDQILRYTAVAEQRFTHPIAKAIRQRAAELQLALPRVADAEYAIGFGVQVDVEDVSLKVGSQRFMEREGITLPSDMFGRLEGIHSQGGSAIFAAADGHLIGLIELQAAPRPEGYRIIQHLRQRGIEHVYLISGDHEMATQALAHRLGIDRYFAQVLPEDKAEHVQALQQQGLKVAMVGDGINDSIALSQADYSISLRGAADVATDVADVIFMDGNLAKFDLLLDISENLRRNMYRSVMLTLIPNSFCIAGALVGVFGFGTSLLLNNAFNLIATANGMLPQYRSGNHVAETEREPYDSSSTSYIVA